MGAKGKNFGEKEDGRDVVATCIRGELDNELSTLSQAQKIASTSEELGNLGQVS